MQFWKDTMESLDKRFQKVVDKVGGPPEKRNLLGIGLEFGAAIVKFPFKFLGGMYKFGKLLFSEPSQAWVYLAFQYERLSQSFIALVGLSFTDHADTFYSDGTLRRKGYREWHGIGRAATWAYAVIIIWCFAPMFIELQWYKTAIFCIFGPLTIWFASGLGAAIRRFRSYRWETFLVNRERTLLNEKNRAVGEQLRANQGLVDAKDTAEVRKDQIELATIESHALITQTKLEAVEMENRLLEAEARRDELKAKGAKHGPIVSKRGSTALDQAMAQMLPGPKTQADQNPPLEGELLEDHSKVDASDESNTKNQGVPDADYEEVL